MKIHYHHKPPATSVLFGELELGDVFYHLPAHSEPKEVCVKIAPLYEMVTPSGISLYVNAINLRTGRGLNVNLSQKVEVPKAELIIEYP